MPEIKCPICEYQTDDIDAVAGAAQLNIHALVHTTAGPRPTSTSDKQKPPRIDRPSITRGTTEEEWNTFTKKWNLFKRGTDIPTSQLTTQLWNCCDKELEDDLFKDVNEIDTITENQLLAAIRRLAVISTATSIRKTELLSMKQDHGQPIRSFAAKIKGKAQVCAFSKNCPAVDCAQNVDYTNDIVKYVIVNGISDEEIKKDILGYSDLDELTLNDTISLIEGKEMAARAMSAYSSLPSRPEGSVSSVMHNHKPQYDRADTQKKLNIKSKCKNCEKEIQKFKLRYGKLREFHLCVECWRKRDNSKKDNNSALFDVVSSLSNGKESQLPTKHHTTPSLQHHIFDGTYGWMVKESKSQPSIDLKLSINKSDYEQLKLPVPLLEKSKKVNVITDTGAQSSLMGLKAFRKCGFDESILLPAKKKMYAANNEGIKIVGAFFGRLSGCDRQGKHVEAPEMIYVTSSTDLFYLSRQGMEKLNIIPSNFPTLGAAASISNLNTSLPDTPSTQTEPPKDTMCKCIPRTLPPPKPNKLPFEACETNIGKMKQWLLDRYASSTFNQCHHQPLPMMKGPAIKIHINPNATPSAVHTPSQIPIHWRDAVKNQLEADVNLGVIEKVPPNTPTTWCHRAIWVRKPDGSPRRVVDFQSLNRQCQRDTHHTVPPFQQVRAIPPSTIRTVTDAWNGYHSVPVRPEDRHLLTFITEFGRYRYCVAPQGFLASGDGYTYRYDEIISDVPRKTKIVDDTALWDGEEDIEEHWWRIIDYLHLMGTEGVTLNPQKFQFSQRNIEFGGFSLTSKEVKPLSKYIDSIKSFPRPSNIGDIRAWFGLVNQVSHYNKLSKIMDPFKPLLSPKTPFVWTEELDRAFEQSKKELIHAIEKGVQIFDPTRLTCLCPDWSTTGIGYWLRQKYCNCSSETPDCCPTGWKITLAGSRFLRSAEKRYAPIEGEALAVAWALEDTKYFTLGCENLIIATDHKPLVKVFGDRALDEITNTRIFRLKERTLAWRFTVIYVPGKSIPASDTTSRNPNPSTLEPTECMEHDILASIKNSLNDISTVTWNRVKQFTNLDQSLQLLKEYITNSFPVDISHLPPELEPLWQYRGDLSIVDDVILVGNRILIPKPLRTDVCHLLHSAHQGISAMNERAKAIVFWPGITNCIKKTREQCESCWRMAPSQPNLPPTQPFVPTYPFEAVATDYCDFKGNHYLITVDRFSNWPEIIKVKPNSANSGSNGLIKSLRKYFATFGVPEEVSSDGGPEFSAKDTKAFFSRWGINHRMSSAYNPRSNGRAEVAVKSMKRLLSDNVSDSGDLDTDRFTRAILQFRNTPDPQNGISPAEVIFGRPIRDSLPFHPQSQIFNNTTIRPIWRDLWTKREETLRTRLTKQTENLHQHTRCLPPLQEGDCCHVQNQTGRFPRKWDKTGRVVQINGNDQYTVRIDGTGRLSLRNRKYLRKYQPLHVSRHVPALNVEMGNCYSTVHPGSSVPPYSKQQSAQYIHEAAPPTTINPSVSQSMVDATSPSVIGLESSSPPSIEESSSPSSIDFSKTDVHQTNDSNALPVRRSTRIRNSPTWHTDYVLK